MSASWLFVVRLEVQEDYEGNGGKETLTLMVAIHKLY